MGALLRSYTEAAMCMSTSEIDPNDKGKDPAAWGLISPSRRWSPSPHALHKIGGKSENKLWIAACFVPDRIQFLSSPAGGLLATERSD